MIINWWQARKEELLTLTEKECPLYVYNEETLNDIFFDLLSIDSLEGLFYPIYLNPHPEILRKAFEMDLGFLCASTNELKELLNGFPKLNSQRILLLCNNACDRDSERAFQYGAHLVVNDSRILKAYPATSQDREDRGIFTLLDLQTAQEAGPWPERSVKGFYVHQEPKWFTLDDANKKITLFTEVSKRFPEALILALGNATDADANHEKWNMDIQGVENYLEAINSACPQFTLWLEIPAPMVSSMGLLLVKVTETEEKEGRPYVRINIDMKASISNRLHEAGHQIINLSKLDEEKAIMTQIMGQNQGYGDALDLTKLPSSIQLGDILLVTNMGICEPCESFNGKGRNGVPEHYLHARRICQVRI